MNNELNKITKELFSLDAIALLNDSTTDQLYDAMIEKARSTIDRYGWTDVFKSWEHYMHENCHTVKEALNFATWFEIYGGNTHKIKNPYEFLAFLYNIFDLSPVRYHAQIMDDVSYGLLEAAGIKSNLWGDDNYTPETDPCLIAEVEKLRKPKDN